MSTQFQIHANKDTNLGARVLQFDGFISFELTAGDSTVIIFLRDDKQLSDLAFRIATASANPISKVSA